MKKLLCAVITLIKIFGECEGMYYSDKERILDFSNIKIDSIPEDSSSARSFFIQGSVFVFTCAVDLDKVCNDVIGILSDESKYSPDVNMLLRDERLLKSDTFPRSLNFLSSFLSILSPKKKEVVSELVSQVEDNIRLQCTALDTEYSGFIEPEELAAVHSFFFQRLQALQNFPK